MLELKAHGEIPICPSPCSAFEMFKHVTGHRSGNPLQIWQFLRSVSGPPNRYISMVWSFLKVQVSWYSQHLSLTCLWLGLSLTHNSEEWRYYKKKTISQGCQSSHIFFCLPALGSCIHRQYHAVSPRVGPTWNGGQTRYSYEIPTSTWGPLVEWMLAMLSKMDAKKRSSDMRALPNSVIYNVPSKDSRMACLLSFLFTHSKTMLRRLDHTGNNIFTNNGNLTWTEVSHSFQEQYRHLGGAPAYISTNSGGSVDGRKKPICDPRLCRPCHHLSWP